MAGYTGACHLNMSCRSAAVDDAWLTGEYPEEAQVALSKEVATALGFDFECGRMDTSPHPFTGGAHPTDVRITTRFRNNDFVQG